MSSHCHIPIMIAALVLYLISILFPAAGAVNTPFDSHYTIDYGQDHVQFFYPHKTQVQLSLDSISGARFSSKHKYRSGFFGMWIKLPAGDSTGVVTSFYLRSEDEEAIDQVDFEFLGSKPGENYSFQTNVIANGIGDREQKMVLPFDPTKEYHYYRILWNSHVIMMLVDDIPIRVFKNYPASGVGYPSKPMKILVSIRDGGDLETDGKWTEIDWSYAPFSAEFRQFSVDGCSSGHNQQDCASKKYYWNQDEWWDLSEAGKDWYETMRKLLTYDYCTDTDRYPVPPPECAWNN